MMLFSGTLSGIMDLNCTENIGGTFKYAQTAVNCQNKLRDDICLKFYTADVKVATDNDRNANCYKLDQNPDPDVIQTAVDSCPRTCGYCCITPEFICEDKRKGQAPPSVHIKIRLAKRSWSTFGGILKAFCISNLFRIVAPSVANSTGSS
ncbi:hypothetical protein KIN20_024441 [Parelaphostrongylus tenuis]|uniref:ShKT domain-containing protein n=1 Tax=Parelaphostrongylus tenuis TaxID=148309 RepID=A0AAD5MX06_PARTN|nr:hypothetical protein KIN20_024441 [Parelaphostrongylus tenuis]